MYWPCFSSMLIFEVWPIQCSTKQRLEISFLHPKQILILCSRQHNRDIPSAAIGWRKAPYDVLFDQFSSPMLISSLCCLVLKTCKMIESKLVNSHAKIRCLCTAIFQLQMVRFCSKRHRLIGNFLQFLRLCNYFGQQLFTCQTTTWVWV